MTAARAQTRRRRVLLASIRRHELDVTIPIQKQVEVYRRIFAGPSDGMLLTKEGGRGHARGQGGRRGGRPLPDGRRRRVPRARAAGAESVTCAVIKCADESDFLVRHVQHNHRPVGTNPILLRRVSDYVSEHGSREAAEALSRLYEGTVHQKFLTLDLDPEAGRILGGLCGFLGARLSQFVLPYYIPHHVSTHRPDVQGEIAGRISGLVRARTVTDARFAWPSPEEIGMLSSSPQYRKDGEEPAVILPEGEHADPREIRLAHQLIRNARDVIVIPGTDKHPPYMVDLKTKRVSEVEDRESVVVLRDAGSEGAGATTYLLPQKAGAWLGLADGGKESAAGIEMAQFEGATGGLAEFAQRHRDARAVVLYRRPGNGAGR